MFIKLFGALIVIASTFMAGVFFSERELMRIEDLEELRRGLGLLKGEVDFCLRPMGEALILVGGRLKGGVSELFIKAGEAMEKRQGESAGDIWEKTITSLADSLFFNTKDLEHIGAFGESLGHLDRNSQVKDIDLTEKFIVEEILKAQEGFSKNSKLYKSLGFLGGVFIVIVLF